MIGTIGLAMVLGRPLFVWFGIAAFCAMLMTVSIALLNRRSIHIIPFKYHPFFAAATILLAAVHIAFVWLRNLGW